MNEFEQELDEISIWIEANRDVSPAEWEENIFPRIKELIKQAVEKHIIGKDGVASRSERCSFTGHTNSLRAEQRQKLNLK